jgi:Tol biopolymer transport system component
MVGKVLAQYQICEKLGEGGMGVVWKALDTHLDRFVALKTLPGERLSDPERKRRFVQEAKAASALNHPNIVHIYDVTETAGTQYISMEYVSGKTLDQLIGRKGLPLREALKYALQIAGALTQAHLAGIIHRDLKPSNIIVTQNGLVKVLDFGLAKLTEVAADPSGETELITERDANKTEEGTIVGTVAYMSPEQAEGKKVDARSDIFSFGSMLYETVTGRPAFHGDSKLSTLSAILKENPKPLSDVMADAPRDLEKIINRCLRKDQDRRFQHMADVKVALEELKEESESGKLASILPTAPRWNKSRWPWALSGTAIVLTALAVGLWFLRPRPHPVPKIVPLTSYPGQQINPAFSPDGKQVAFAWDGEKGDNFDIYVKLVDAGNPLRLTNNPEDEFAPTWSPDGRYIAFCRDRGGGSEIWMIPALGGAEQRLGESGGCSRLSLHTGLSWSPDGRFLALTDRSSSGSPFGLYLLSPETGEKRRLTSPPNGYYGDLNPQFSPDGKTLAFIRARTYNLANLGIYLLPLSSSGEPQREARRLISDQPFIGGFDFTPEAQSIVFSPGQLGNTNLWAVSVAGGRSERLVGGENAWDISISRTGNRLVYSRFSFDSNIWRIPGPNALDKKSPPMRFIASTRADAEPQFSPDGKKIVFSSSRSGTLAIWICDRDGVNPVELTSFNEIFPGSPRWSPDSRWIAFDGLKAGNSDIYVIRADGGPVRRVTSGPSNNVRPSWSRDGRWIYFGSNRSGDLQIWKVPAQGGAASQVTKRGGWEPFESFDGNFVYYTKLGSVGVWKVPTRGGEETQVLDHGSGGLWAMTEQGIYFGEIDVSFVPVLKFYRFATRQMEIVKQFPRDIRLDLTAETALSVSPDGQWILYTQWDQLGSDLMLMENYR